jgi:hypothetical protein
VKALSCVSKGIKGALIKLKSSVIFSFRGVYNKNIIIFYTIDKASIATLSSYIRVVAKADIKFLPF